jgi:hypothetical protein
VPKSHPRLRIAEPNTNPDASLLSPDATRFPDVKVLLVSQRADGFFLERLNERGTFVALTRHDGMDDAMREAYSEYGQISEWRFVRMMLIHWNTSGGDLSSDRSLEPPFGMNHPFAESRASTRWPKYQCCCGRDGAARCNRQARCRVSIGNSGDQPNARTLCSVAEAARGSPSR